MQREVEALNKMRNLFDNDYNELYDILYYYVLTYLDGDRCNLLFLDECENATGLRDHDKIIDFILEFEVE